MNTVLVVIDANHHAEADIAEIGARLLARCWRVRYVSAQNLCAEAMHDIRLLVMACAPDELAIDLQNAIQKRAKAGMRISDLVDVSQTVAAMTA